MLRAGLLPGAEVGMAAARLGAVTAAGLCSRVSLCRGIPQPGCTHRSAEPLQRTAGSHHLPSLSPTNLSQPWISPYKNPRIDVFLAHDTTGLSLGVREHGSAIRPLCTLLQVSCKCIFWALPFGTSLRSWPVTSRRSKTRMSFKVLLSSTGFTENPKRRSGFLGSQTAEEKKVLLEAV